jgi:mannose-1-phosphate guanylyltransferase
VPESDLANAGLYLLDAEAWREVAGMNAFDFGFDVLPRFVGRMRGYVHPGYHRDIGTPQTLEAAEADAPRLFGGAA